MTERTFLTTAKTEADVRKIAEWYGWQAEEDNEGQIIIYTDIPEGAPQVAQEAAAIYNWDYDSDNYGAILLYTGVCAAGTRPVVEGGGCTQEEADYWKEYAKAASE